MEQVVAEQAKQRDADADGGRDQRRCDTAADGGRVRDPARRQRVEGVHDAQNRAEQPEQGCRRHDGVQQPQPRPDAAADLDELRRQGFVRA